jgi:hypothetical protein
MPTEWPFHFFQMLLLSKEPIRHKKKKKKKMSRPEEAAEGAHQPMTDQGKQGELSNNIFPSSSSLFFVSDDNSDDHRS